MIEKSESLSMSEAAEYIGDNADMKAFVKKFVKLKPEKAKELRSKIEELDLMKVRHDHISKIIDLLPESKEELNKIFSDVGLEDEEVTKLLDIIKEFK